MDKKSWVLRRLRVVPHFYSCVVSVTGFMYHVMCQLLLFFIILAAWSLLTARCAKLYLSWIQCSRFIDFIELISLWWIEWLNEPFWELMTDKSSRRKSLVVNSAQGLKLISLFLSNNYYFNNANIYTGYLSVILKRTVIKRGL